MTFDMDAIAKQIAETKERRQRLAEYVSQLLIDDAKPFAAFAADAEDAGAVTVTIIPEQPEVVLVEYGGELFAIKVEDA